MPRYLAVSTSDNTWLHNEYMGVRGLRELDIRIILHLVALKRMLHVSPHSSSADRSRCSRTWSASERMGRYTRQSSANSRTCESTTLGVEQEQQWTQDCPLGHSRVHRHWPQLPAIHHYTLYPVLQKCCCPFKDWAGDAIKLQLPQHAIVRNCIKCFGEV